MALPVLRSISGATLRPNPACEFVAPAALSVRESRYAAGRTSETDAAGVLRQRDTPGPVLKLIDAPSRRALEQLGQPAPGNTQNVLNALGGAALARLVFDGAVEIETAAGFRCGPAAFDALVERFDDCDGSATARLSRHAVTHAAAFDAGESSELSARLYCHGRIPASPRWRAAIPRRDSVADYLHIRDGLPGGPRVRAAWQAQHEARPGNGWLSWSRREVPGNGPLRQGFKLYVSPAPATVRDCFAALVAALSTSTASSFKIGGDVFGLLRPDKIVAYFPAFEDLEAAATSIGRALHGVRAHGVPFTCAFDADGLLSWACDPPALAARPERESWRLWITNRLSDALLHYKAHPSDTVAAATFAFARLALEGVDPGSWAPVNVAWRPAPVAA